MSNKENDNNEQQYIGSIVLPENESLIVQFEYFLAHYGQTPWDIVGFLSVLNARHLKKAQDHIDWVEGEKEDLVAFYEYFMENYGDETYEARMKHWGGEPMIFRLADLVQREVSWEDEQKLYLKQKAELENISEEDLEKARELADRLWSISADRIYTFSLNDGHGEMVTQPLFLPVTLNPRAWEKAQTFLLYSCTALLLGAGGMIARVCKRGSDNVHIFGICGGFGEWESVSAEDMMDSYTLRPNGSKRPLREDVTFTTLEEAEKGLDK